MLPAFFRSQSIASTNTGSNYLIVSGSILYRVFFLPKINLFCVSYVKMYVTLKLEPRTLEFL